MPTKLVVTFDVTGWTQDQIDSLALNASVQGEAFSQEGGDAGQSYPDVRSVTTQVS